MKFNTLSSGYLPEFGKLIPGKVRDNHIVGDKRILVASDRISAFDRVLEVLIPEKGAVLNAIAMWWFEQTENLVANHVIDWPDPNVIIAKQADVLPVEMVVRGYITGSAWKDVESGLFSEKYGFEITPKMIEGGKLEKNCKLKEPTITPTTKAHSGHDEPLTAEAAAALCGKEYEKITKQAVKLFMRGGEIAQERGLLLVDTKYEFGWLNSKLLLVDEVHTPDSSRFWMSDEYKSGVEMMELSKQFVRDIVQKSVLTQKDATETSHRYIKLYERLSGNAWKPTSDDVTVQQRVINNLTRKGHIKGGYVQILAGSESDDWHVSKIQSELDNLKIPHGHQVLSAHKKTQELLELIADLNRSLEPVVAVTVAGGSDALSGVVAHHATFPVIACPPYKDEISYALNVHSTLQMPSLAPALYCKRPGNAAQAAARILANNNQNFAARLE